MKSIIRSAIIALAMVAFFAGNAQAVKSGEMAPDFSLSSADGKTYKLADLRGKTVVLEWLNHGCPFVKKHYSKEQMNMQNLQKKYTGKGVVWLSVISSAPGKQGHSTAEKALQDQKEHGAAPTAILLDKDGKVGKAYDAKTTPHMFVINAEGKIAYQGAIDDKPTADTKDIPSAKNFVAGALDHVLDSKLSAKALAVNTTKPYGCSVKYE